MTKISLDHIGNRYYVSALGHANFAENGKDIVCAGVSALAQAFAFVAQDLEEDNKCTIVEMESHEGLFICVVDCNDDSLDSAFRMTELGMRCIADEYSDYAKVV